MNPRDDSRETINKDTSLLALLTSICISPARFWEALSGAGWLEEERAHLKDCAPCRTYEARVKAALAEQTPMVLRFPATQPLRRFLKCDAAAVASIELLPTQRLSFEGEPDLVGNFYQERNRSHWLALAHRRHPAGTLLLIEVSGASGVALQRLVMLRPDRPVPTGRVCVETALPEGNCTVQVEVVESVARLTADLAPLLAASFRAARHEDPNAVGVWRAWAEAAKTEAVPSEVATQLKEIAEG